MIGTSRPTRGTREGIDRMNMAERIYYLETGHNLVEEEEESEHGAVGAPSRPVYGGDGE